MGERKKPTLDSLGAPRTRPARSPAYFIGALLGCFLLLLVLVLVGGLVIRAAAWSVGGC